MSAATIVVAGGGTGGHVYPGLAVAGALRSLADVQVVFVGTTQGLEARVVPEAGYRLELLDVQPLKGGGLRQALRGTVVAARETARAVALVKRLRPHAVLSVGGYAAGPMSLAAACARVPLAVLEPNRVMGLANRLLAPLSARGYLAWDETARYFRAGRALVAGAPLRPGFLPQPYAPRAGNARVLVMGGSQGAEPLNTRLPPAIARARVSVGTVEVVHQAGRGRDAAVREAYARQGVRSVRVVPFLDDVPGEMARADVVVARAGALTVAEISVIGRPSILIPFPHAADDHQARNAEALAQRGAAVALRQDVADPARIARELVYLLADAGGRVRMADAVRAHGRPHAANEIARDLLELIAISPTGPQVRYVNGASAPSRTEMA